MAAANRGGQSTNPQAGVVVESAGGESRSPVPGISRPVFILALVSLLTDISSEAVYPLIPLFLTSTLGAPVAAVGLIEGFAEGTASASRTASGWLSDRLRVRRPLVFLGYGLSALAKPLLAVVHAWPAVFGVRFADRMGKGLRSAPRDALIADATPAALRGRAFGFHRAADTIGAVAGPAAALGLLAAFNDNFRLIFLLAFVPAAVGVALVILVRDGAPANVDAGSVGPVSLQLGAPFYLFLAVSMLFALGNSSDAFLVLRSKDLGLSNTSVVLAYMVFNTTYALLSMPVGIVSDKIGRRTVIIAGFSIFAFVYSGFALAQDSWLVWPLFAVYGFHMAFTEGVGRAFIVDIVPAHRRATALGLYQGLMGGMILLSSIIAGVMWDQISSSAPFLFGSATALVAAAALLGLPLLWARWPLSKRASR